MPRVRSLRAAQIKPYAESPQSFGMLGKVEANERMLCMLCMVSVETLLLPCCVLSPARLKQCARLRKASQGFARLGSEADLLPALQESSGVQVERRAELDAVFGGLSK